MKIILSLAIIIIYWLLDAYQAMLHFNISYKDAVLLNYDHSNYIIKFLIVIIIFTLSMISLKKDKPDEDETDSKPTQLDTIYKISDVILAPLPLHKQLNSVVDIIENELKIKTAFVASFEKDTIFLLNTNESLKIINIKEKYLPHQDHLAKESLDSLLSICFLEKRDFIDDMIQINGITYRALVKSYKYTHSDKTLGVIVFILDENDQEDYTNFLARISTQVAFTVNLTRKKEAAIEAQARYNAQFSSMDTELNIPSNSKLQEMIEHEMKRSQRYGTELSLMIIEIDHMRNLSNIFTEKETLALKKDVVSVLKKSVRETDIFGKWAENHFAIVAPDVDYRGTKSFAVKLNRKLQEHRFPKVGKVTCSYGITSFTSKDTIGDFRKRAENALKEAVQRGGNSIEIKILV